MGRTWAGGTGEPASDNHPDAPNGAAMLLLGLVCGGLLAALLTLAVGRDCPPEVVPAPVITRDPDAAALTRGDQRSPHQIEGAANGPVPYAGDERDGSQAGPLPTM
jgi:hypothetical protein